MMRRSHDYKSAPGVLLSNGPTWVEFRRTSLHTLRDFGFGKNVIEDIIEDEIDNFLNHIDNHIVNHPIKTQNFFKIPVLASLWRIISGEQLKIGDPKLENLVQILNDVIVDFAKPLFNIAIHYPSLFKLLHKIGVLKSEQILGAFLDFSQETIEKHKEKDIDGENPLTFTESMLHKIQQTTDKNNPFYGEIGELNLLNVLVDLFIAGSDTTANTLNWAMLYMILNPDIQSKVRNELDQNIGKHSKAKMSQKNDTPYTEAVLHEIQRKANLLPLSVFHAASTDIKAGDHIIPENTNIIPLIGEIMNDPKNFPDPEKFDPERYLTRNEADGTIKFQPDPKVIPFGIGRRKCLGENLARMSLYKFFTAIIQKYEITSDPEQKVNESARIGFVRSPITDSVIFKPR